MSGIVGKNAGRASGIVGVGDIGADAIDGSNIADDAIDSEHYTDGSIDNAHIADDAIDSEHYADGSIDNAHIADDAIDSEHYADGSIDEAHIADNAVTLAKMAGGTDGQIITFDASGDPVAVGPGTDGQVLTSTGAGSPPAFEAAAGGGNAKNGRASLDLSAVTGTVAVTSMGFTPKMIQIFGAKDGTEQFFFAHFGTQDNAMQSYEDDASGLISLTGLDAGAQLRKDGSNRQDITLASLDADGFTLTNTKVGSPTGTGYFIWMALG